jgi:hypothetical protein
MEQTGCEQTPGRAIWVLAEFVKVIEEDGSRWACIRIRAPWESQTALRAAIRVTADFVDRYGAGATSSNLIKMLPLAHPVWLASKPMLGAVGGEIGAVGVA